MLAQVLAVELAREVEELSGLLFTLEHALQNGQDLQVLCLAVVIIEEASIAPLDDNSDQTLGGSASLDQALDRVFLLPMPFELSLVLQIPHKRFLLKHLVLQFQLVRLLR